MTADDWKAAALYLADCHAATAEYDGSLRSVSSARKKRLRSICREASRLLRGYPAKRCSLFDVIDRLDRAAAKEDT